MLDRSVFKDFCILVVIFGLILSSSLSAEQELDKKTTNNSILYQPKSTSSSIDTDVAACSSSPELEGKYRSILLDPALDPSKMHISADKSYGSRQKMNLEGNVIIKGDGKTIRADEIIYDQAENKITAKGHVFYSNKGFAVKADSGYKQIRGERAEFHNGRVWLESSKARADAQHLVIVSKTTAIFNKITYSTCSDTSRFWELKASKFKINREKGTGHAKNVLIKVKGIPIFYLPSLSFAIDQKRKSGFLMPSFGDTGSSGNDVKIPFYWNIAPNRDATLTSRFLSKRGYQFIGEYRYLSKNAKGVIGLEFLPDDNNFANQDRNLFYYRQKARIGKNWSTDVDLNSVSDGSYVEDLGNRLTDTALTQLERKIDLKYSRPFWSLAMRLQSFQPLKGIAESYRRLPQILLDGNIPHSSNRKLTYHLQTEAVLFDHANNVTTGLRYDIMPGISYKLLDKPGYFLNTRLNYRYTSYDLNLPAGSTGDSSPSRSLPIFNIDSGLFFDRSIKIGKSKFTHSLEPRLFYLYVPSQDQSDLPVFDTSRLTLDINQLFRSNRYSGADRQSDANQLTFTLTSRFIRDDTNQERFRATLGQIYYLKNRSVTLPGEQVETGNSSDAVAEISWAFTPYQRITASTQWDPDRTDTKVTIFEYRYKHGKKHLFNVAYRFRENSIEQTDISSVWGLSRRWSAIGRWNYSIRDETTLEGFAGLEYNNCCWAMRLVGRTYIRDTNSEKENTIQLQFVLKGLTKLGDNMESLLKTSILGYEDTLE